MAKEDDDLISQSVLDMLQEAHEKSEAISSGVPLTSEEQLEASSNHCDNCNVCMGILYEVAAVKSTLEDRLEGLARHFERRKVPQRIALIVILIGAVIWCFGARVGRENERYRDPSLLIAVLGSFIIDIKRLVGANLYRRWKDQ